MNQNKLMEKSAVMNLCGIIGCALAVLGMVIPMYRVSAFGYGMSFTMFTDMNDGGTSLWVLIPLLLTAGACTLYVLKMERAGFLAALLSAFVFFVILVIKRAIGNSEAGGTGVGFHYTIGFYIAFLGFMIAIAAPWINKLIFKPQPKQPKQQFDPNMPQGPAMNQGNPFMNQGQPQPGQFGQQANPYMNQGQPQPGQFAQQANPYMNQAAQNMQQQANPYMQQMQNHAGQFAQQANPYLNQMQNQAAQAHNAVNQAVQNAENKIDQQ